MLRLFGAPTCDLPDGHRPRDLPLKAFVLIALLRLEHGRAATREQVRSRIWEDSEPRKARDSLRTLLADIRRVERASGRTYVEAATDKISLGPAAANSDLELLLATTRIDTVDEALALANAVRGDFLAGVDEAVGPLLQMEIARHRADLRRHFAELIAPAAEAMGGTHGDALLRSLLNDFPDDESLFRRLMKNVHREKGDARLAGEYRDFTHRLWRDFGTRPSVETQALLARLVPRLAVDADPIPGEIDQSAHSPGPPRVVLLPPPNLLGDAATHALACALIGDVTLRLCRQRTFAMLAPHTARQIEGADPVAATAPLEAGYVATTSLLPGEGTALALGVSIIEASTREIIFGDHFDFDAASLGQRFADLASTIAARVDGSIAAKELAAFRMTGSASAYVHYLLGANSFDPQDLKRLRKARHHFERALRVQPDYVPALTGMARCLTKEAVAFRRADRELLDRAMNLSVRAGEIDPLDPNASREKAHASLYLHDLDASLHFLDVALSRARHHADLLADKADVLVHTSRYAESRRVILQAMELNPLAPDLYLWTLGSAEFFLGRYAAAVESLERMSRPKSASRLLAAAAAKAGDADKARRYRMSFQQNFPDATLDDVRAFVPSRNRTDVEHYIDALALAGFR